MLYFLLSLPVIPILVFQWPLDRKLGRKRGEKYGKRRVLVFMGFRNHMKVLYYFGTQSEINIYVTCDLPTPFFLACDIWKCFINPESFKAQLYNKEVVINNKDSSVILSKFFMKLIDMKTWLLKMNHVTMITTLIMESDHIVRSFYCMTAEIRCIQGAVRTFKVNTSI